MKTAITLLALAFAAGARAQQPPGRGWNVILRLYAPLQPWFDKTWKPGDMEMVP